MLINKSNIKKVKLEDKYYEQKNKKIIEIIERTIFN